MTHHKHVTEVPQHLLEKLKEKILSKIKKDEKTGCWEWQDKTEPNGYARVFMAPYRWPVHRAACWIFKGPFPQEAFICHTCDNRKCCNPDHLYVGSHKSNMEDMKKRGRYRGVPPPPCKGEDCKWAKITERQAIMILELYALYPTVAGIAKVTGIHRKTISDIVNGNSWRHINENSDIY